MRAWTLALPVDRSDPAPVVRQIARAIAEHVRAGRLRPGERLPGTRALSRALDVHRNTVAAAYAELAAEGWTSSAPGRGTFVSDEIPTGLPRRPAATAPARGPGYDLPPFPAPPPPRDPARDFIDLEGGIPDLRLVPVAELARAYRRALRRPGILRYADPRGQARLRAAIGAMLRSTRGLDPDPERLIVTRGAQLAISLAARALIRPGDVVAVEELGYRAAWEAFRAAGARLLPVPLDDGGLRVDALEALARREQIRAVYLTPHHQYPTTATLPAGRRLALLRLAAARRIAVVEDDFDCEFHYDGGPVLPLAASDPAGVVVYVGTLSKVLAPGLRLGYVHAPREAIACLAEHRRYVDRQGDGALELAIAELLEDGEIPQHVWRMRRIYAARRDALAAALGRNLDGVVEFALPPGGMALWCRVAGSVDVEAWARASAARGVPFDTGRAFAFDGAPRPALRLGFAAEAERELREGVRRMAAALPRAR
ncbi:MAG TPA: PLP-dependent aminotransferase family protein [Anaeromyxobacter sp.]|nr:PLP-dependent aminotransferase family protein [Anaeromyxobacter sp.]